MKTFHGKQSVKDKYIKRLKAHAEADNILQGSYWEDGKGCAVGCTIEGNDHKKYETELGIPEWLAHLEDRIFEMLPREEAKKFPLEFLEAIPVGVCENDMYKLRCDLDFYRLSNLLQNLEPEEFGAEKAVREVIRLNFEYTDIDDERWEAAYLEAYSAADLVEWASVDSVMSAVYSAARSETYSAADSAVSSAVRLSTGSGRSAAWIKEKENLIKGLKKLKGNIEKESVREMTLAEVCEKLGEEIKIIK